MNQAFSEELMLLAQSHVSDLTQGDGTELNLEEDPNLELSFLIPQHGYSCDTFRGIPPGLQDFLEPMISGGELHISIPMKIAKKNYTMEPLHCGHLLDLVKCPV